MPGREKLPSTLKRALAKVQRTWIKTHDSAVEEYGERARAYRHKGPSDPQAKKRGKTAREGKGETFGRIHYQGSTEELYERVKKLDVSGRSSMSKKELERAIARKQ
jgi:hypothetical protein